tara:strand:- start:2489 stop:3916 length:1428 start_codon:yes stop_codon:yes gene_type:complete
MINYKKKYLKYKTKYNNAKMDYIGGVRKVKKHKNYSKSVKSVSDELKIAFENNYIDLKTVDDNSEIIVIGDIHNGIIALHSICKDLNAKDFFVDFSRNFKLNNNKYIVFTGDFIDRGPYGLEVLLYIILLFNNNPNNVMLIAGNHEQKGTYKKYGFEEEMEKQLRINNDSIIDLFEKINLNEIYKKNYIFDDKDINNPFYWNDIINNQDRNEYNNNIENKDYDNIDTQFFNNKNMDVYNEVFEGIYNLIGKQTYIEEPNKDLLEKFRLELNNIYSMSELFELFLKLLPCAGILNFKGENILFKHGGIPEDWVFEYNVSNAENLNIRTVKQFLWNDYVLENVYNDYDISSRSDIARTIPLIRAIKKLNESDIYFTISGHQDQEMFSLLTYEDEVNDYELIISEIYKEEELRIFKEQSGIKTIYPGIDNNNRVFMTSTAHPVRIPGVNKYCYLKIYGNNDDDLPIKMDINFIELDTY